MFQYCFWQAALAVLSLLIGASFPAHAAYSQEPFRVVAYLPEYRALTVDPGVLGGVTDLIFFSIAPTQDGGIDTTNLTPLIKARLQEIKRRYPKLRLLVAIGGADRSDAFAPMAKDPRRREKFIGELLRFCQTHGFSGVDFDWEFPRNQAESSTLNALILETKSMLFRHGLLVTLAVAPWDRFPKEVLSSVDSLHLMTYFDGTQHTALANARRETEDLIRKGADPHKICMGMPFYGEMVGQKDKTPSYGEIMQKHHPVPESDEADGVAFNGIRTVRHKTRYALERSLGGVMIWEIGQDTPDGTLLNAIRAEIGTNLPNNENKSDKPDISASEAPSDALWLDELDLSLMYQDWGEPGKARSVEKNSLSLRGVTYAHGIGTHAESEWHIDLKGSARRLLADVGIDDEKKGQGSCRFEVWVDEKRQYQSRLLHGGDLPEHVDVDLSGAQTLQLVVTDGGDGHAFDHADWAGALLLLKPGVDSRPIAKGIADEPARPIWSGPESPVPAIHGPRVVGGTPGRPFLFRIPATGEPPLRYTARGLPSGLSLNESTGVLSGVLETLGTTVVDIAVTGPKGRGKRKLAIVAGKNAVALTPPMGWNSWNIWGTSVTAEHIRAAAGAFETTGLAAHGFAYLNIDDGWASGREADGTIRVNETFGAIKPLADAVHAKGLKLGIYSSPGPKTCGGFEGSFGYVSQDVRSYADWGIDYLKYDWCTYMGIAPNPNRAACIWPYRVMQRALETASRDIVYSVCQYGMSDVWEWGQSVGANSWRTTGDITDTWSSVVSIGFEQSSTQYPYAGPGHWNDPDMLVVGRVGWGPNSHPTRLKPNEQISHVTLWCLQAAPLLIGCDLTRLDPFTKSLLTNDEVLEVDQDPLGQQGRRVRRDGKTEVWTRPLFDSTMAVGLFNRGARETVMTVRWQDLGITGRQPVRDLWQHRDLGRHRSFSVAVPAHGAVLVKIGSPERSEYIPGNR